MRNGPRAVCRAWRPGTDEQPRSKGMGTMIQTAADAVRQLDRLAARTAQNMKAVNRKQGLRPSERAMWLADLQADIDALKFVISVFNGGPLTHVLDEVVDGK